MHWPGAGMLMMLGMVLVCLIFIPVLIASKLKSKEIQFPVYIYVTGFIGLIVYLLGFLFKVMHWPGASILLSAGTILIIIISFPQYVFKVYKNESHISNSFIYLVIVLVWFILPTMLISINIPRDYLGSMFVNAKSLETDQAFFIKSNKEYYNLLSKNEKANELKIKSQALYSLIQKLKINFANYNQNRNSSDTIINLDRTNAYEIGAHKSVLFGQDKMGEKLQKELLEYQKYIAKINPAHSDLLKQISQVNLKRAPEKVLIASINELNMIQLSVLETENYALKCLVLQAKTILNK
jgi:hypothetical protein